MPSSLSDKPKLGTIYFLDFVSEIELFIHSTYNVPGAMCVLTMI